MMKQPNRHFIVALAVLFWTGSVSFGSSTTSLGILVGAAGEEQYESVFQETAAQWETAGEQAGAEVVVFNGGIEGGPTDAERLEEWLGRTHSVQGDLWLVFIGHGTFDGRNARFNLQGPDITSKDLADWLKPLNRRVILFQGASASAPFINQLSGPDRVIITATRSGTELNYARFGKFAAEALSDPATDVDQDGQNSALEIFLAAARATKDWYAAENRLPTEHPLIDDNGDGRGTPADWFKGLRVTSKPADDSQPDGLRANQVHLLRSEFESSLTDEQRKWRDEQELKLEQLRLKKSRLSEEAYLEQLEVLLLELARFYQSLEPS